MIKVTVWAALLMLSMALGCDSGKPAAPGKANPPTDDSRQAPDNSEQAAVRAPGSQRSAIQPESPGPALGNPGRGAAVYTESETEEPASTAATKVATDDEPAGPGSGQMGTPGGQTLRGLGSAITRALGKSIAGGSSSPADDAADVPPPEDDPFPQGEPEDPELEEPEDPQIEE